jgi:hypothetical protein
MDPHPAKTTPADRRIAREARAAAKRGRAAALREGGATLADIGRALGLSVEGARRLVLQAERRASRPDWHSRLNNTRALRFLRERDLSGLLELEAAEAVARLSRKELKAEPNLGKGALAAIEAWLAGHGLALRDEIPTRRNRQNGKHDGASVMLAP